MRRSAPNGLARLITAGFFVCDPSVFGYIADGAISREIHAVGRLARGGRADGTQHTGFCKPTDILRDERALGEL
jgi:glucose-1-phosphate cytidylyltransferase